jgi:transposase
VTKIDSNLFELPEDSASLRVLVQQLLLEREEQKRHVDEQQRRADEQSQQKEQLQVELVRVKLELERYKKWHYGPRADRLQSSGDLAQLLLNFFEELERKPVHPEDIPPHAEPEEDLRRVKRCSGRRHLANFANLPITTHVHELSAKERACPCCGVERKEIGAEESWQVEYLPGHFERIHHVCKKYACLGYESHGDNPRIEMAAKLETAIDKGMAGPGLLAYIVTSKFSDYVGFAIMLCRGSAGAWMLCFANLKTT